jgi:hypothetical protein
MAKCTETCPKCGSVGITNGVANYWPCGSHDRRGFFYQSDLCEAREELAAANAEIERLRAEGDKWKASYDDLASRIDKYPRTSDVVRIGVLTKVIEQCRIELANVIMQTNATEGGSVWRAYQATKDVLSQKGAPHA